MFRRVSFRPGVGRSIPSVLLRAMPGHLQLRELVGAYVNGNGKRTIVENRETAKSSDAPHGARALRVASMIAFIAALLGLVNGTCWGQTPTERSVRPLRF